MPRFLPNVRYALRLFAKAPGFTMTAVVVLAVGIGLNAAVFTVINALFLKPIGGPSSGELAALVCADRDKPGTFRAFSYDDYSLVRDTRVGFSSVLAQRFDSVGVTEDGATRRSFAAAVSSNYFSTLATRPVTGREFLASEEDSPSTAVTIVSHAFWRRHGLSTSILGRSVRLDGRDFTIVGVMPASFSGTTALFSPEFWVPLRALDQPPASQPAGDLNLVARLKPELTREGAAPLLATLAARLPQREPATGDRSGTVLSLHAVSRLSPGSGGQADRESAGVMLFLLGMSAVVLLIATLNLANMLLARSSARQREVGLRMALGARPIQVLRQLLTESLLVSACGGVLGLALATLGLRVLASRVAPVLPFVIAADTLPDYRVVLATAAFGLVSALAFGLGPSLHLVRRDLLPQIKPSPASASAGARHRLRHLLVASQLAMSLALLTAGGLFVQGAWKATTADPGFRLERGIVATIDPSLAGSDERRGREISRAALERVRSMPGVQSASAASSVPFGTTSEMRAVRRADRKAEDVRWSTFTVAGSDYFETLQLPVLRGREFDRAEEESGGGRRVAIVNEALVRTLWPDGFALGQTIQLSDDGVQWEQPLEVIGIAPAIRQGLFDTEAVPHVYVPSGAAYRAEMTVHARMNGTVTAEDGALLQQVRRELRLADSDLPILSVRTLEQHRDASLYMWIARATANLFTCFAVAALGLAMLGIYGVKAYLVSRRTREIGIRVALGASRIDILRLVVGDSLRLILGGLCVGFALSLMLSRVLASWVYGLEGLDAIVPVVAALLLAACALAASYIPARRAMSIAPSIALRIE